MPPRSGGYAQKTTLVGIRVSDYEDPKGIIHNSQFIIHNSIDNSQLIANPKYQNTTKDTPHAHGLPASPPPSVG